jgi:hypothetical protein
MSRTPSDTSPGARALRAAGYVRVPGGMWATQEQLDLIMYMLRQNLPEINAIKERAYEWPQSYNARYDGERTG